MGADASKISDALDKGKTGKLDRKKASEIAKNLPKKMAAYADAFLGEAKGDTVDMKSLFAHFEGKKIDQRGIFQAIKKANAPKAASLVFTDEELKKAAGIDAMAEKPRGRPTPEQAEALKKQKVAKGKFLDECRARLGLSKKDWSDKKMTKAIEEFKKSSAEAEKKKAMISLEPPSGTRDFFPKEYAVQKWLFQKMKETAKAFSFQEYDAPVLEHAELYKRKAGEEITAQMYNFIDKEGAEVTLRPEMTPTLARMVMQKMDERGEIRELLPLKWFSIPQCWRFETVQRGRKREHYQWNMDIVGVPGVTAELELLAAVTTFFKSIGITGKDVGIKINSRKVLGAIVEAAGVPKEMFAPVCVIIDKLDKIGPECVTAELTEKKVPVESSKMILRAMECKSIEELAELCKGKVDMTAVDEMKTLFAYAKDYGFADFLIFDASVVRGLAYYTGIVFECFDRQKKLRAICGGGRYDRLLSLYGSQKEVPCCGFGFGDCVIMELLKELKLMDKVLEECKRKVDFVVAPFNAELFGAACSVAAMLRSGGFTVDMMQKAEKKVRNAFSYADRAGATYIVLVAPSEWEKKAVTVKSLRTGGREDEDRGEEIALADLVAKMQKAFSR
uniref:histidine--tRNA ligase n=1 Tax=Lotharella globosa TaxID=91324 RepID=A0A7S3ZCI4_9EUKA